MGRLPSKCRDGEGVDSGCDRGLGLKPSYVVRADPILISASNDWVSKCKTDNEHRRHLYFG